VTGCGTISMCQPWRRYNEEQPPAWHLANADQLVSVRVGSLAVSIHRA
jgi:hypothetical protein